MDSSNLFKQIFVNTSSQIVAKVATVVLGFLTVGLLTRYLGVAQYGIYNLVFAYLAFFGIFADFGLQLTLVRELSEDQSSSNVKSTYFFIKMGSTLVSTALALLILIFFPYSQTMKMAIAVGAVAVAAGYLNAYGSSVLQLKLKLDKAALLEVINRIVTVCAIVLFVLLNLNLYAIISAILIGNIVSLIINISFVPDYFKLNYLPSIHVISDVIKVSFPIGITTLLAVLYFKIDILMLSVMKTTADLGIYSLSYKIFENIIMLWLFYTASIYPLMSRYIKAQNNKDLRVIFKSSLIIAILFAILVIIVSLFAAPLVINILGGNNFIPSILPLRILVFALPFVFVNNLLYYLLLSLSKVRLILWTLSISLILNFAINLIVIPTYGYIGTSISTVITEIAVMIGYTLCLVKVRGFNNS